MCLNNKLSTNFKCNRVSKKTLHKTADKSELFGNFSFRTTSGKKAFSTAVSPLLITVFLMSSCSHYPHSVNYRQKRYPHIGKNRFPHGSNAKSAEAEKNSFYT